MLREQASGFDGAKYLSLKDCGRSDRRAFEWLVSRSTGIRVSLTTVTLIGGAVFVGEASTIRWEQPVPRPMLMVRTPPIKSREKL